MNDHESSCDYHKDPNIENNSLLFTCQCPDASKIATLLSCLRTHTETSGSGPHSHGTQSTRAANSSKSQIATVFVTPKGLTFHVYGLANQSQCSVDLSSDSQIFSTYECGSERVTTEMQTKNDDTNADGTEWIHGGMFRINLTTVLNCLNLFSNLDQHGSSSNFSFSTGGGDGPQYATDSSKRVLLGMSYDKIDAIFTVELEQGNDAKTSLAGSVLGGGGGVGGALLSTSAIRGTHHDDTHDTDGGGLDNLAISFRSSPLVFRAILSSSYLSQAVTELRQHCKENGASVVTLGVSPTRGLELGSVGNFGDLLLSLPYQRGANDGYRSLEMERPNSDDKDIKVEVDERHYSYTLTSFLQGMKGLDVANETCVSLNEVGMLAVQHQVLSLGVNSDAQPPPQPNFVDFMMTCIVPEEEEDEDTQDQSNDVILPPSRTAIGTTPAAALRKIQNHVPKRTIIQPAVSTATPRRNHEEAANAAVDIESELKEFINSSAKKQDSDSDESDDGQQHQQHTPHQLSQLPLIPHQASVPQNSNRKNQQSNEEYDNSGNHHQSTPQDRTPNSAMSHRNTNRRSQLRKREQQSQSPQQQQRDRQSQNKNRRSENNNETMITEEGATPVIHRSQVRPRRSPRRHTDNTMSNTSINTTTRRPSVPKKRTASKPPRSARSTATKRRVDNNDVARTPSTRARRTSTSSSSPSSPLPPTIKRNRRTTNPSNPSTNRRNTNTNANDAPPSPSSLSSSPPPTIKRNRHPSNTIQRNNHNSTLQKLERPKHPEKHVPATPPHYSDDDRINGSESPELMFGNTILNPTNVENDSQLNKTHFSSDSSDEQSPQQYVNDDDSQDEFETSNDTIPYARAGNKTQSKTAHTNSKNLSKHTPKNTSSPLSLSQSSFSTDNDSEQEFE